MKRLREQRKDRYVSAYCVALTYAALAEQELAFEWLEKARQDQSEWIGWIGSDARFDSLRSDPRFAALQRRVGLTQ